MSEERVLLSVISLAFPKQRNPALGTRELLANTENSALISADEFFGSYLDQRGFTATTCKHDFSFHHFGINQEHRLISEGGSSSTRIAGFFQDFCWCRQAKPLSLQRFSNP